MSQGARVGYAMLAHERLDRAAQLARHWAATGHPVAIHVDARVPAAEIDAMRAALGDLPEVTFCARFAGEWGGWGLVQGALAAGGALLKRAEVTHVALVSGACLPLRPAAELDAYLAARPATDFVESVTIADVGWTVGGLDAERFTLRFPVSYRRHRRWFDRAVAVQRRLGLARRIPEGLVPHLGSQWWCLTRGTLGAILSDPRRAAFDRYFRGVWIPDESYVQTLARRHAARIESRSLTFAKFGAHGRPHVFYDDHLPLLRASGCFLARKAWPGAQGLYDAFLGAAPARGAAEPEPGRIARVLDGAAARRRRARPGLVSQSSDPRYGRETALSAAPLTVIQGIEALFEGAEDWLAAATGARVHGRLFHPGGARFAGGGETFAGGLSAAPALRDRSPRAFLRSLAWNAGPERQAFVLHPDDGQDAVWHLAVDPKVTVELVPGAWAVGLHRAGPAAEMRAEAARLQRIEAETLRVLRARECRARVELRPLAEALRDPEGALGAVARRLADGAPKDLPPPPRADLRGLPAFLRDLRDGGMTPHLAGDVPLPAAEGSAR